jgi:hypothetical protein
MRHLRFGTTMVTNEQWCIDRRDNVRAKGL